MNIISIVVALTINSNVIWASNACIIIVTAIGKCGYNGVPRFAPYNIEP